MDARVLRIGVELDLVHDPALAAADATHRRELTAREQAGDVVLVRSRQFVDLVLDGEPEPWHGNEKHAYVELDRDPTTQLMDIVSDQRWHLDNLYADLAHGGEMDVTRWEFYAAPFHVELQPDLEQRLADAWRPRPPRKR